MYLRKMETKCLEALQSIAEENNKNGDDYISDMKPYELHIYMISYKVRWDFF